MIARTLGITLLAVGITLTPVASKAEGRHPYYASARRDLRAAQLLLRVPEEPVIAKSLKVADEEAEAAVTEVDRAAVLDREDLDDHPPVDLSMTLKDRIAKIAELLRGATSDVNKEEDSPAAHTWRAATLSHIEKAFRALVQASSDAGFEPKQFARNNWYICPMNTA